jgi:hypothetical protein
MRYFESIPIFAHAATPAVVLKSSSAHRFAGLALAQFLQN